MVDSGVNVPTWRQKLAAELRRDKRKTVFLGGLLVVAGVVAGRLIVRELTPSGARADTPAAVSFPAVPRGDLRPVPPPGTLAQRPGGPGQYAKQLDRRITRDIFSPNPDYFPPEPPPDPPVVVPPPTVDPDAEARAVRAQAQGLKLQSTVVSQTSTAIINGRVLRVGEWINGFEVIQITSRTCSVKKSGVEVVLRMNG